MQHIAKTIVARWPKGKTQVSTAHALLGRQEQADQHGGAQEDSRPSLSRRVSWLQLGRTNTVRGMQSPSGYAGVEHG